MGTETLVEYLKGLATAAFGEFRAILYGKMGVACWRHPYIESHQLSNIVGISMSIAITSRLQTLNM